MFKRAFDIAAATLAILVLSPLLVPVMIALRLTGEGEVFYLQERIGRGGKPFRIIKFATMLKNSAVLPGGDITVANDPRILPLGGFLRRTKINELPQLFNILFGDMSVIGYRPLTPRMAAMFSSAYWNEVGRLRPGLSGIGSIVFRDEERLLEGVEDRQAFYADAIVPYKAALELWYASHQGFLLDMKLIALTVLAVLRPSTDATRYFADLPASNGLLAGARRSAAAQV